MHPGWLFDCHKYLCRNLSFHKLWMRCLVFHSVKYKCHYDVLGVDKDASPAEIKTAFFRLSKKYHPDKNRNDPSMHNKFVQLNEAYTILSDAKTKRLYDYGLRHGHTPDNYSTYQQYTGSPYGSTWGSGPFHRPSGIDDFEHGPQYWRDDAYWNFRPERDDPFTRQRNYYGVPGISRLPNFVIVLFIIIFVGIANYSNLKFRSYTAEQRLSNLDKKSFENSTVLQRIQDEVKKRSPDEQIEIMQKRINESAEKAKKFHRKKTKKDFSND